jgi:hypothetical protein
MPELSPFGRNVDWEDDTMNRTILLTALPAALLFLGTGPANAGKTIEEAGALASYTRI